MAVYPPAHVSAVCQLAGDKASELGVTKIEHEVVLARFGPGHILALSACIGIQELASWLVP
jgi:hypothetical protein